ncbi:bile acid:sodium symporter family protein [Puniceibacterium confluentis]|uniref:bile acid:sodium symporter family protein n=1 Tax=Puniceibacterium confluentis TaxID=1958944 RepID=UPI0011B531C3|nr:bile acid:sodium symporter family protein [Puniceibacterium confluentis]
MSYLKRIGIDLYMIFLLATVALAFFVPALGVAAILLSHVTFWAVALLFFLYGAKLNSGVVVAGMTNWRLQGLTLAATYLMIPLVGLALTLVAGPMLGATVTLGLMFLAVLPSTVQSSVAFTGMAGGNVPAAICAASVSNLVGVVLTPLLVATLLHTGDGSIRLDAVIKIAAQILLPFVLGQLVRPWIGRHVQKHKTLTLMVDRGAILLIVFSAFSAGTVSGLWVSLPIKTLATLSIVVLAFLAITMSLIIWAGKMTTLPAPDRAVLLYCGSTKSLASGLPIATALFPPEDLAAIVLPLMIYHMAQLLTCAFLSQKAARASIALQS